MWKRGSSGAVAQATQESQTPAVQAAVAASPTPARKRVTMPRVFKRIASRTQTVAPGKSSMHGSPVLDLPSPLSLPERPTASYANGDLAVQAEGDSAEESFPALAVLVEEAFQREGQPEIGDDVNIVIDDCESRDSPELLEAASATETHDRDIHDSLALEGAAGEENVGSEEPVDLCALVPVLRRGQEVDDEIFAGFADKVPLDENGYKTVAAFRSNYAMKRFTRRLLAKQQWMVEPGQEQSLAGLMWEHSGMRGSSSMDQLLHDLKAAPWISKSCGPIDASASSCGQADAMALSLMRPPADLPQPHVAPLEHPSLMADAHHATSADRSIELRTAQEVVASNADFKQASAPPALTASPECQRHNHITATEAQDAHGACSGVCVPVSEVRRVIEPDGDKTGNGPWTVSQDTGTGCAVGHVPEEAPVGLGEEAAAQPGKGKVCPGVVEGNKGPPLSQTAADKGTASTTAILAKASGNGKGPPPPPPKAAAACTGQGSSLSPSTPAATGKGVGPPAPPVGKGPLLAGKGPGKGPPPAVPGKGAAGGKGGAQPSREEKQEWVSKTKNNLRWKRCLRSQGLIANTVFDTEEEEPVDLQALEAWITRQADVKRPGLDRAEREAPREILWEATDKHPPAKRRTQISILMKTWQKSADHFLERLKRLELEGIMKDPEFNQDLFEQLVDMVKTVTKVEWGRLIEDGADQRFEWDNGVEGFFKELQTISHFQDRLAGMRGHLAIQRDIDRLKSRIVQVKDGVQAIRQSKVLPLTLRKILHIGNCLNAGSAVLGRADGFDVVLLLEKCVLTDMPKGWDGKTSLLQHIKDKELSTEQRNEFGELEKALRGWSIPKGTDDKDKDPTDLNKIRDDSGKIALQLSQLEDQLALAIRRHSGLSDLPEGDKKRYLESRLAVLNCYEGVLLGHRAAIDQIDVDLDLLNTEVPELHRYFLAEPRPETRSSVWKIFGVVSCLAQKLTPEIQPQWRRKREVSQGRDNEPGKERREDSQEPGKAGEECRARRPSESRRAFSRGGHHFGRSETPPREPSAEPAAPLLPRARDRPAEEAAGHHRTTGGQAPRLPSQGQRTAVAGATPGEGGRAGSAVSEGADTPARGAKDVAPAARERSHKSQAPRLPSPGPRTRRSEATAGPFDK